MYNNSPTTQGGWKRDNEGKISRLLIDSAGRYICTRRAKGNQRYSIQAVDYEYNTEQNPNNYCCVSQLTRLRLPCLRRCVAICVPVYVSHPVRPLVYWSSIIWSYPSLNRIAPRCREKGNAREPRTSTAKNLGFYMMRLSHGRPLNFNSAILQQDFNFT
jgi:hypothetical protein